MTQTKDENNRPEIKINNEACCGPSCCPGMERRSFVKLGAAGLAAASVMGIKPVMAGPFVREDLKNRIPLDKKLDPDWVAALTKRGKPETYTLERDELKYIGMPVGGIACGQLYLGGDGQLWYWGIFDSRTYSGYSDMVYRPIVLGNDYRAPLEQDAQIARDTWYVEQGFAVQVKKDAESSIKKLNAIGYDDIEFRGEYPVARVRYKDPVDKIDVQLEAFSPFCPLNVEDSSLPTSVLEYTATNNGDTVAEVSIGGWLENAVCPLAADPALGHRVTEIHRENSGTCIIHYSSPRDDSEDSIKRLKEVSGYGSMSLTLLRGTDRTEESGVIGRENIPENVFGLKNNSRSEAKKIILSPKPIGAVSGSVTLHPGESHTFVFLLSWYFPNYAQEKGEMGAITGWGKYKREYARRFDGAKSVNDYVIENKERLFGQTKQWNETYYDSTLPYWFLDRSFISMDCLASQTMHWFDNGRWWGWEGTNCCPGTCQHVWNYAQGMARIFPEIEKYLRDEIDFGLSWQENGELWYRSESGKTIAHDGQAGTIIRAYREHLMSKDGDFLKRRWPRIKKSVEFMMVEDGNDNGILEGRQYNTLDASWYGPMAWVSSLYLGCVQAGKAMAVEMGDTTFADRCTKILKAGRKNMVAQLFNGEYFIHIPDPDHPDAINTNEGSEIDQVMGQNLMRQVGLPGIIPEKEAKSAQQSLYKYNFMPDAGAYRNSMQDKIPGGRWYAMVGEGGLLICTFPKGGALKAVGGRKGDLFAAYLNECMNGFEYQAATGMVWEDMVQEGLVCFKAVHDRYHASKRNPYNEVECSNHYSRSMAAYGFLLAICGYDYHGPKGRLAFAPKLHPEKFKAPFTTAEGWGTFVQERSKNEQTNSIRLRYGQLVLNEFSVQLPNKVKVKNSKLLINGNKIRAQGVADPDGRYVWKINSKKLKDGDYLESSIKIEA